MAISDQLTRLAVRAKDLEDRAAAATHKEKAELRRDVRNARDAAQAHAAVLSEHADERRDELSKSWVKVQREWNSHVASIRKAFDKDRMQHDANKAERAAKSADENAAFAVKFAYTAIEEAEYAVLDAELAHMDADELADALPPD